MSNNRTSEGIATLLLSFAALIIAYFAGYAVARHHIDDQHEVVSDTIYVERWDTIKIAEPHEITRHVHHYDTIRLTDEPTIVITIDSTAIIPTEQAIYQDTTINAKYKAYVSGYMPILDSIDIQCKQIETIVTNTEKIPPRRIGVGIQAGIGYCGKIAPYVGIGIQYRLW